MKNMPKYKFTIIAMSGAITLVIVVFFTPLLLSPVPAQDTSLPSEDSRVTIAREQCDVDLNHDGDCNHEDTALLSDAIGSCKGDANYTDLADVDHDGCVTRADQEQLFPMFVREDRGQPCDLDFDGECDRKDLNLFSKSIHMCFDDSPIVSGEFRHQYSPLADADQDGCVFADDLKLLFPVIPER